MGITCVICRNPNRIKIEEARISGDSLRKISEIFNVCHMGIYRHFKAGHVKDDSVKQ